MGFTEKILAFYPFARNSLRALFAGAWLLAALPCVAAEKVTLQALFKDKAIVLIDGTRRVLTVGGTSPEGVTLRATDTQAERAEIEIAGRRETLELGVVFGSFTAGDRGSVTLYAEPDGHFHAQGSINGSAVQFLVDTGATTIALSGAEATRLGIDYKKRGRAGYASTAGGMVRMYALRLDSVQLGTITLYNVEAGVVEGSYPREALLGMSFLSRVDLKRDGERLELTQRF